MRTHVSLPFHTKGFPFLLSAHAQGARWANPRPGIIHPMCLVAVFQLYFILFYCCCCLWFSFLRPNGVYLFLLYCCRCANESVYIRDSNTFYLVPVKKNKNPSPEACFISFQTRSASECHHHTLS